MEMNYTIYIPKQGGASFEKENRFISHGYYINGNCYLAVVKSNQPITPKSTGIWNQYFVYPLSQLITYFAEFIR